MIRRRREGQILILTVLAISMLVALIFYVYNVGDQVNRRADMQNTADSVAVSGAGWMARSMNVVAMNNVAQSRMIALVPAIDALTLSCEMAHSEVEAWGRGLEDVLVQLRADQTLDSQVRDKIVGGLDVLLARLVRQRDILEPILAIGNDIELSTTWSVRGADGAAPHGRLWRAAVSLEEFSFLTAASAGLLAQANAVTFAGANNSSRAFISPVVPRMPAVRGSLADFEPVLRHHLKVDLMQQNVSYETSGRGGAIGQPAWPYRLGPWARLLCRPGRYHSPTNRVTGDYPPARGWRSSWGPRIRIGTRTVDVPAREGRRITGPSAGGGRSGGGAGRGSGSQAGGTYDRSIYRTEVHGYRTYGPYRWARNLITGFGYDNLRDTRFYDDYYPKIADQKLSYIFGPANPTLGSLHYPMWITDLVEARRLGSDPQIQKTLTRYFYMEVISKEPEGSSGWAASITSSNLSNPVARDFPGWVAPEDLKARAFSNSGQVVGPVQVGGIPMWKFTATGVERIYYSDGTLKDEWPVYFSWYFVFGGVDVGGSVDISNPANWDNLDTLPAPLVMDEDALDYTDDPDAGARRRSFTYLGVVRKGSRSAAWNARFSSGNPSGTIYALAQAKVFNNSSWDLWTQDWQVQLSRVRGWEDWVWRLGNDVSLADMTDDVSSIDVEMAYDYMLALDPSIAEMFLSH